MPIPLIILIESCKVAAIPINTCTHTYTYTHLHTLLHTLNFTGSLAEKGSHVTKLELMRSEMVQEVSGGVFRKIGWTQLV